MDIIKNTKSINDFSKNILLTNNIPVPIVLSERHPHIVNNMMLFWGHKDFADYTDKLILNEQNPERMNRQGFLPDAFLEILNLLELHNQRFPQFSKNIKSLFHNSKNY